MDETMTKGEFILRLGTALNREYMEILEMVPTEVGTIPISSDALWLLRSVAKRIAKEFGLDSTEYNTLSSMIIRDDRSAA